MGNHAEAIQLARSIWESSSRIEAIYRGPSVQDSIDDLLVKWESNPDDPSSARRLAEAIHQMESHETYSDRLRELAKTHPALPRVQWIWFQTNLKRNRVGTAAEIALFLAKQVIENEGPATD